jgi:hypothetical protein
VIVLRHLETDARQIVASLDGIDLDVWEATEEDVPADLASRAYTVVDGDLVPRPPVMPLFQYLLLWTATEALAVEDTTDPELRRAYQLLRALATVDLALPEVQAGIARARQLNILTEARAARIAAGLPPL